MEFSIFGHLRVNGETEDQVHEKFEKWYMDNGYLWTGVTGELSENAKMVKNAGETPPTIEMTEKEADEWHKQMKLSR